MKFNGKGKIIAHRLTETEKFHVMSSFLSTKVDYKTRLCKAANFKCVTLYRL